MRDITEKWKAVTENDNSYDGCFYYAVKSTGIFCRPSCKSKVPSQENVEYFKTAQEAIAAGYRPCKRCRPDLIDYRPALETAEQIKLVIETCYTEKSLLATELGKLGLSKHRMVELFRMQYDMTLTQYADHLRIEAAKDKLINSEEDIINIAMFLGFDSISAFYSFFRKHLQTTPSHYRQLHSAYSSSLYPFHYAYKTELGNIMIASDGNAINAVQFEEMTPWTGKKNTNKLTDLAAKQIEEYLAGKRKQFHLPLKLSGTTFQKSVWEYLISIPYGETCSYKQVAQNIGNPNASRAVGMANNKNPILIIVPCHRVVGSNGALAGYAGGLEIKQKLLDLEMKYK